MGTLLKYEFRRSRMIFLGILGISLLIEAIYLIGWFAKIDTLFGIGLIGGILCMAFGATAILLYGVVMFNDDISKKPGYLLFSTPRNAAQIVGAKLLMTLFALLGITVLFALLISLDGYLALRRTGTTIVGLLSIIDTSVTESGLKDAIFNGYNLFGLCMFLLTTVISFIFNVITAYVVIVLLKTIMGSQKGRGILGVILWFAITYAFSTLGGLISTAFLNNIPNGEIMLSESGISSTLLIQDFLHILFSPALYLPILLIDVVGSVAGYLLTTWMIEKKLSL